MFSLFKEGFHKIKEALTKTRLSFKQKLQSLFQKPWNEETFEELEKILYEADIGSEIAMDAIHFVKKRVTSSSPSLEEIETLLEAFALDILLKVPPPKRELSSPHVIMMVGVNGTGKTTTCAKLARRFLQEKKKPLLAAADTFRAAAVEQLDILAKRLQVDLIRSQAGSDPAAVAFDALQAAQSRNADVVIIDTAGRLQSKNHLMAELEKMRKVMGKVIPGAPHETFLVLDATMGQNAIDQAKTFHECTPITGIILTKIDGSAKGGIVLPLSRHLHIPILYLGTGEKEEDLIDFNKEEFVKSLFRD